MKTFMKFTLAVFVMLLAGAAADTFKHKQANLAEELANPSESGCHRLLNRGNNNIRWLRDWNDDKATDYQTHLWASGAGLRYMLDVGCFWCDAKRDASGKLERRALVNARCNAYANELDQYIGLKRAYYDGKAANKGRWMPLEIYGFWVPHVARSKFLWCAASGKNGKAANRSNYDASKRQYFKFGENNAWGLKAGTTPSISVSSGDVCKFEALATADRCFTRGCNLPGFKDLKGHDVPQNQMNKIYGYSRKTMDTQSAPVNQSKGFDGYQTALIVGLSVLSSFITAGSIYACRRLNEKAIELPVDVEDKIVIA